MASCKSRWDEYYNPNTTVSETESNEDVKTFFKNTPEFSKFYQEIESCGLDVELEKDQQMTIWVVDNEGMDNADIIPNDTVRIKYHMNYIPFLYSDIKNCCSRSSLNGVYLQINNQGRDIA